MMTTQMQPTPMMPPQNMFGLRAGLPATGAPGMMTTGPGSLPPGMMPPGMMPPQPGGPSAGVMPWRGGMQRPATQGPQNFMRQRMGLM